MMLKTKVWMLLVLALLCGCTKSDTTEPPKPTTPNEPPPLPDIEPPSQPVPPPIVEPLPPPIVEPVTYQVTLSWVAPTEMEDGTPLNSQDIEAYYIQWGESENNLTNTIPIAKNINHYTIESLSQGDYYFSIQVEDQFGNRSDLSNLVSKTFP